MVPMRRRTKADKVHGTTGHRASGPGPWLQDPFGREAGAVLAVLLLARYWPGRFPDGWVSMADFAKYCGRLAIPTERDSGRMDTYKRLIRKGIMEIRRDLPKGAIERRPIGRTALKGDPRDRITRLRHPPPPVLDDWFVRFAVEYVQSDEYRAFGEHAYGVLGGPTDYAGLMEEAILDRLIRLGEFDRAVDRASSALKRAEVGEAQCTLHLALASIELRRPVAGSGARALAILRPLARNFATTGHIGSRVIEGRIHLAMAEAEMKEAVESFTYDMDTARDHLDRARELIPLEDYRHRGDLSLAEAMIADWDIRDIANFVGIMSAEQVEASDRRRRKVELAVLAAFRAWRLGQCWDQIHAGLDLLLLSSGGMGGLAHRHLKGSPILLPWLAAVLEYTEVVEYLEPNLRISLCTEIVVILEQHPPTEQYPLSPRDCYRLFRRCAAILRGVNFYHPAARRAVPHSALRAIKKSPWYREIEVKTGCDE